MTKLEIITPSGMFGGQAGEHALYTAMRIIGVGFGEEGGWNAKYGADYENDVFLMKRYCWCERDDCPWCAGCGAFEDACRACSVDHHAVDCFRNVLSAQKASWDAAHPKAAYDPQQKAHSALNLALRQARRLPESPYQWECDCGGEARGEAARDAEGCDYHKGVGMFARFAPWTHDGGRRYYDPPNFWFKPDNFRVTWYKYIGRDMAANKDAVSPDFMERIFATHPRGMTLADAVEETARQEEETAAGFARMFADLGVATGGQNPLSGT